MAAEVERMQRGFREARGAWALATKDARPSQLTAGASRSSSAELRNSRRARRVALAHHTLDTRSKRYVRLRNQTQLVLSREGPELRTFWEVALSGCPQGQTHRFGNRARISSDVRRSTVAADRRWPWSKPLPAVRVAKLFARPNRVGHDCLGNRLQPVVLLHV